MRMGQTKDRSGGGTGAFRRAQCGKRYAAVLAAAVACMLAPAASFAQPLPAGVLAATIPPQNVVTLAASASVDVTKDWLTVVFSTSRDGSDAATVQHQLQQALDAALAEARKAARPGQVEVHTGAFSLMPRYAPPKAGAPAVPGGIVGWQGSTELVVEGRDAQAIAQLTSRVQTLTIARVGYSLSRDARQKVEADVAAQAIDRFRARADAVSRQFGFAGYTLREVAVSAESGGFEQPVPMVRMKAVAAPASDGALPVEAGKQTVSASVSGSVQMQIK